MSHDAATILIVEDDEPVRTFLADNLTADGHEVLLAGTVHDALRELEYRRPDLALVDLGLPDGSGLELLERLRETDGLVSRLDPAPAGDPAHRPHRGDRPHARLRARGGRLRVEALLLSRAAATTGRGAAAHADAPRHGPPAGRGARDRPAVAGGPPARPARRLSGKEFALLRALAAEPTRVLTKEELLREVWGFRTMGTTRTLDSHACRLRQKLARDGDRFVVNVWGVGYRLVDGPAPDEPGDA